MAPSYLCEPIRWPSLLAKPATDFNLYVWGVTGMFYLLSTVISLSFRSTKVRLIKAYFIYVISHLFYLFDRAWTLFHLSDWLHVHTTCNFISLHSDQLAADSTYRIFYSVKKHKIHSTVNRTRSRFLQDVITAKPEYPREAHRPISILHHRRPGWNKIWFTGRCVFPGTLSGKIRSGWRACCQTAAL